MKVKNIMIIGCGESGSESASKLSREGHNVYIVDKNIDNFSLLHDDYSGMTICREVTDMEVLHDLTREIPDVLMIVTEDDDQNIFLSVIACELLGVKNVVTRLYDEDKSCLLHDYDINVIYPSLLAHEAIKKSLGMHI